MSDPARCALTEAFSLYLTVPDDATFKKKDDLVKSLIIKNHHKRIRYDKDHRHIVSLPNLNTVNGHQTRVSRINTTAKAARAMWCGKLIAAAENQSLIKSLWLRYAYDPYLDVNPVMKGHTERRLYPLLMGLWCLYPRRKTPKIELLQRALALFDCVIDDIVIECRTGLTNRKSSHTFKAEQMGYGKGKQAYQHADYSRAWAPIEADLRTMLKQLDKQAMDPVAEALQLLTRRLDERDLIHKREDYGQCPTKPKRILINQ